MPEWYICSPWGHQPHCDVSLFFFFLSENRFFFFNRKRVDLECFEKLYIYIYSCCLFISNGFDIRSNTKMEQSLLVGARAFILIFCMHFICLKYLIVILWKHLLFLASLCRGTKSSPPPLPLFYVQGLRHT